MPEGTVSQVAVTPGSGSNVATFSISEGGGTKQIQRIALSDSNGNDLAGSTSDAAAANTDTTPISWMAVFKQISLSVQAIATSVAGTLATTATQAGNWVMRLNDGSGNSISSTGGSLNVNVTNGSSGGTALADEAAFTEGTTNATPIGGVYKSSQTALTSGQFGAVALSALREFMGLGKVWDGTNTATVKPASTAPASTDTALVVAIHPLSVNANGQTTMSASAPVVLPSNQSTIAVAQDTSQIMNGASGVSLSPLTAKVNISTATTTTVINAVAGKQIRILACYLIAGVAENINWQSHTTTSNSDAPLPLSATGGFVLPFNPVGWFDTNSGEALDIVTSAAGQLSGRIVYVAH